jgi:uncharacterized protein (DUF2384 family)
VAGKRTAPRKEQLPKIPRSAGSPGIGLPPDQRKKRKGSAEKFVPATDLPARITLGEATGTDLEQWHEFVLRVRPRHLTTGEALTRAILASATYEELRNRLSELSAAAAQPAFSERALDIVKDAYETFGSEDKAIHWLNRRNEFTGGDSPLAILEDSDESQYELVEKELLRIKFGQFA